MVRIWRSLLILGISAVTIAVSLSSAWYTDTASVGANTFTTGTVDVTTLPTTAAITFSTMAPGDVVYAPLTVNNPGTLPLRYAIVTTTTENTLAALLDLTVKGSTAVATASAAANAALCSAGQWGNGVWTSTVYGGSGVDLGSMAGIKTIGDVAVGQNGVATTGGDRTLNAGQSDVLCMKVELPSAVTTGQGATTTADFVVTAEQTANT